MNDYYNGFDPYNDPRSVFQYQKQLFCQNTYDKYRTHLEKTTPAYAGQTNTAGGGGGAAARQLNPPVFRRLTPRRTCQGFPRHIYDFRWAS